MGKKINMEDFGFSNVGDLTQLTKDLENVFKKHFPDKKHAFGLAFTLFPNFEVHWATNVPRDIGIQIFEEVAEKMKVGIN